MKASACSVAPPSLGTTWFSTPPVPLARLPSFTLGSQSPSKSLCPGSGRESDHLKFVGRKSPSRRVLLWDVSAAGKSVGWGGGLEYLLASNKAALQRPLGCRCPSLPLNPDTKPLPFTSSPSRSHQSSVTIPFAPRTYPLSSHSPWWSLVYLDLVFKSVTTKTVSLSRAERILDFPVPLAPRPTS